MRRHVVLKRRVLLETVESENEGGRKRKVPPLRFAPVGMTELFVEPMTELFLERWRGYFSNQWDVRW